MLCDAVSGLLLNHYLIWKLLDHWLSYKTVTMLWCFGNFLVDLNLWIFVGCLLSSRQDLFKAGHQRSVHGRTSDVYACLTSDFRVMSGLTLQWVMTRLSKDKNL